MTKLQTAFGVALLVVLTMIAYDLHRLANMASGFGVGFARGLVRAASETETREQRDRRLQRDTQTAILDGEAILATPSPHKKPIK